MEWVALVVVAALVEYAVFGALVGRARNTFGVQAPAVGGHPLFERYMRVHQNTLEQLVLFVPAVWLFGWYVSPRLAALLGLLFVAGRFLYFRGYVADPKKRSTGFLLTVVAQAVLLLGGAVGALLALR